MTTTQTSTAVLRPSFRKYLSTARARGGTTLTTVLAFTAAVKLLSHPIGFDVFFAVIVAGVFLMLVPICLFLLLARIRLDGDRVTWRGVVRRGSFPIRDVARIETEDVAATFGVSEPVIKIRDGSRHVLLRVRTVYWSDESVMVLRDFLTRRFYL